MMNEERTCLRGKAVSNQARGSKPANARTQQLRKQESSAAPSLPPAAGQGYTKGCVPGGTW